MVQDIDKINSEFYDAFGDQFDKLPFKDILPNLLLKYRQGTEMLEIGSGVGTLALWLTQQGLNVTCIEPVEKLALRAQRQRAARNPCHNSKFPHRSKI